MANPTEAEVQHRRSGKTGMTAIQNAPTPAMRDMMREVFSGDEDPFDRLETIKTDFGDIKIVLNPFMADDTIGVSHDGKPLAVCKIDAPR